MLRLAILCSFGGGDPGKAYLAFVKASQSGDLDSRLKFNSLSPEENEEMKSMFEKLKKESPEKFKAMLAHLSALSPKDAKILGGYINGKDAMLNVEAVDQESNKKNKLRVLMKLDGDQWKIINEQWDPIILK